MKKYTNLIVLGIILVAALTFFIVKNVNFNDVLISAGYYDDKITIMNTADIHGHIVFDDQAGGYYTLDEVNIMMGMPTLKYLADEVRKNNDNTLLLDSGDLFHGTNEANIDKGQGVLEIANLMGYNAMTPGNHDFNYGLGRLMEISQQLNFPVLSSNIYKDGKPLFEEYRIVEAGGKKIALFGLTVEDALSYTNSRELDGVTIESAFEVSARLVPELKKQADIVILISHLGDEVDREVARQVDGIDLILAGHHHFLYEKPDKINNTYIVEAGGYSTHLGIADMYLKDGKVAKVTWTAKNTKDKTKVDKAAGQVADKYHAIAIENGKEIVGKAMVDLDGMRSRVRTRETSFGNILADAMREAGNADIALMNGGGIRESIPKGDINLYNVSKALPFINSLVTIELKGEQIYQAIERGIRQYPSGASNGGFLHVSGISFEFDASKPAGKRLVKVLKDGKPLEMDKYYKVATNDYLYNGGDNYEEFVDARLISRGELLKDVLAKYIKAKGQVEPKVEGRIKVVNERYK